MSDENADAQLKALQPLATQILVFFSLSHDVSFRLRREKLIELGAQDVMDAEGADDEFVPRVRALLHRFQPPRILIVEDDKEISDWTADVLRDGGMAVKQASTLTRVLKQYLLMR